MIDTLLTNLERLRPPAFWDELRLQAGEYFVVTLHRPANVDEGGAFPDSGGDRRGHARSPVIFPVHPRTQNLRELADLPQACIWSSRSPIWSSTIWSSTPRR
jgi:UDP-N-acetylglucosamine 2-epimerase (non-hydrolysing)